MFSRLTSASPLLGPQLGPMLLIAVFAILSVGAGAVIATGNLVLTVVALGALFGVLLLGALDVAVWIILFGTMLVLGPVMLFAPQLGRISWALSMVGLLMLPASVLAMGTTRARFPVGMPGFLMASVLFLMWAIVTLSLGEGDLNEWISAFKRYFQFWGLMLVLATVPFGEKSIKRWMLFFIAVAAIQFVPALYQRLVLVDVRWNMTHGVVPIDIVAGTFEAVLTGGGNSGGMSVLLIVALAFVVAAWRDKLMSGGRALLLGAIIAAPLGLGETKVVLVMLPIALMAVTFDLIRKKPVTFMAITVMGSVLLAGLLWVYTEGQKDLDGRRQLTIEQRIQDMVDYNFGDKGYFGGNSLNRMTVLPYWAKKNLPDDPLHAVFGHGLGASFASDGDSVGGAGHVDRRWRGMNVGLTSASAILWDMGMVGFGLYLLILGGAFLTTRRLVAMHESGWRRVAARTLSAAVLMLAIMLIYSDVLIGAATVQVMASCIFGFIARLWRDGPRA